MCDWVSYSKFNVSFSFKFSDEKFSTKMTLDNETIFKPKSLYP